MKFKKQMNIGEEDKKREMEANHKGQLTRENKLRLREGRGQGAGLDG